MKSGCSDLWIVLVFCETLIIVYCLKYTQDSCIFELIWKICIFLRVSWICSLRKKGDLTTNINKVIRQHKIMKPPNNLYNLAIFIYLSNTSTLYRKLHKSKLCLKNIVRRCTKFWALMHIHEKRNPEKEHLKYKFSHPTYNVKLLNAVQTW